MLIMKKLADNGGWRGSVYAFQQAGGEDEEHGCVGSTAVSL
jgi:hypothetical protein